MQMKIGVIAHLKHPIRAPFAGGLEMHTYALCSRLRWRGHKVTLFAAAGSDGTLDVEEICHQPENAEVNSAAQFRQEHRIYLKLMEHLRQRDFDIIHNNSLHYLPPALAGGLPMPMVTVLHTPPFWEMEGSIRQNESSNSRFVAVSSFIAALWAPVTRIDRVITNGIDLEKFRFALNPDASPYVVWSGRIVPEKGLHLALSAAQQAGLHLRIAGPISDATYFQREIRHRLDETLRYVGHLGHLELADLFRGARAVLFTPLWEEPYGLVLAEALACGTPVAAFARGAVGEILDESCGIIVPAEDVPALAQAAHDVQALSRRACRQRAEAIADAGIMIEQYENFYQRLILECQPVASGVAPASSGFPDPSGPRALLDHYMAHLPAIASKIPDSLSP
jgi:glycosyltransferase involved in cell wall biosynthesis